MTTTINTPSLRNIIISGSAAADGSGVLCGWNGRGAFPLAQLRAAHSEAGLSATTAPKAKSCIAHAGHAIRRLDNLGYVVRRARKNETNTGIRDRWDARWIVSRALSATAQVGDAMGEVVLTVELSGDQLSCQGRSDLAAQVTELFTALRDSEIYQAGDVTAWMVRALMYDCGATRLGLGYFVPNGGRALALRLYTALSVQWGAGWLWLPVATSEELKSGIARALSEDVAVVAESLAARIAAAAADKRDVRPGEAAALLRNLEGISERLLAYRALCGDEMIRPVAAQVNELAAQLRSRSNDSAIRGAMLELDVEPVAAPAPKVDPAAKVQAAIAARRAELDAAEQADLAARRRAFDEVVEESRARNASVVANLVDSGTVTIARPVVEIDAETRTDAQAALAAPEPKSEYEAAMYDRFAGIELD